MKKILSNLAIFILLWLSFAMLLLSGYWFITQDKLIASIIGVISLISIIVSIWLMKNEVRKQDVRLGNSKIIQEEIVEESFIEPSSSTDLEETKVYEKMTVDTSNDYDMTAMDDTLTNDDDLKEHILNLSLPIISNETYDFEDHFNAFLNDMIDKEMFLKSIDYYQVDKIVDYPHKLNTKIYKYQFHPIPLIALVKSVRKNEGYKVMVGINSKSMQHVANIPAEHYEEINQIYPQLNNIKGSILGGAYVVVDENGETNYDTEILSIDLRLYY